MAVPNRYQAKAELHFTFGALAVESHFMPAFSQANWLLGVGAVKPTARMRARIVTKPFMARGYVEEIIQGRSPFFFFGGPDIFLCGAFTSSKKPAAFYLCDSARAGAREI